MRRTKTVATLGPALDDRDKLRAALEAGIDVVRLNFSHGTHDTHARRLRDVREMATRLDRNIGVLADLQGPKIRLGALPDDGIHLETDSEVVLLPGREQLDSYSSEGPTALPVVYEALGSDCDPGSMILIDDGSIRLVVSRASEDEVIAKVVAGNVAKSRKGVNLPGVDVSAPCLTDKDEEDLKVAVDLGCDWIALSFVRRASDIEQARQRIAEAGGEADERDGEGGDGDHGGAGQGRPRTDRCRPARRSAGSHRGHATARADREGRTASAPLEQSDETDPEEALIVAQGDGWWVDARLPVDVLFKATGLDDHDSEGDTVGGLVLGLAEHNLRRLTSGAQASRNCVNTSSLSCFAVTNST